MAQDSIKELRAESIEEFWLNELDSTQKEILSIIFKEGFIEIKNGMITISVASQFIENYGKDNIHKVADIISKYLTEKIEKEIFYGYPNLSEDCEKAINGFFDQFMEEQSKKHIFLKETKLEFLENKKRLPLFVKEVMKK